MLPARSLRRWPSRFRGPIVLGTPQFECRESKYAATLTISGGTPPYEVDGQTIAENGAFTTDLVDSGTSVSVEVVDSVGCSASATFTHTCPPVCTLPCAGIALRRGYRMWLPEADPNNPYERYNLDDLVFSVEASLGSAVDLSNDVRGVIKATAARLAAGDPFQKTVETWLAQINKIVANSPALHEAGKATWLTLSYESLERAAWEFCGSSTSSVSTSISASRRASYGAGRAKVCGCLTRPTARLSS